MERAATIRAIPSSRKRGFNWQFLGFWLSYLGVIVNVVCYLL